MAVTQQFNISTSLGRLTLNLMLSFAQFERELIGERTRDKMPAARKKGKWTGGYPLLGFDIVPGGGRSVINEEEAARVRAIFAMFEANGSVRLTLQEIKRRGWRLKRARNKHLALLNGLLFCESCATRMVYTYAMKHGRKYPYYLCLNAQPKGWVACPAKSLPAHGIEESVLGRIREKRLRVFDSAGWEQMDRTLQVEAIQAVVERVGYDGTAWQVSIRFHSEAQA